MKTRVFIVILFLVAFAFAPAKLNAQGTYSAKLISPRLGQVLNQGQRFRIEWMARLPDMENLFLCEMELWLSLDGGRTFNPPVITPVVVPSTRGHYDWTVPNTPTNAAVIDIRFGCELGYPRYYPETASPQPASTFVIR
jgi:hypothetical protein